MAGCHHRLNRHGFGWTPGVDDGQGGLACCGSLGCKESDTTEQLNRTELYDIFCIIFHTIKNTLISGVYSKLHTNFKCSAVIWAGGYCKEEINTMEL